MVTITPQGFFLVLAAVVAVGFTIDYFFARTRITSILPLMIIGLLLVLSGVISGGRLDDLRSIAGFVSAFAVAVILLTVGLEMDLVRLYRVFGRALAWTLACQVTTGIILGLIAYYTLGWPILWCMVFGFAVSGPSSIVVQALVRRMTMREDLKTSLLFEAVVSDVLQLVVPTILILIYEKGQVTGGDITVIVSLAVFGSIALGVGAGLVWVWALDRGRKVAAGYVWVLTFTMALGIYSVATYLNFTASLAIFLFGVIVGNAALLDKARGTDLSAARGWAERLLVRLRRGLRLDSASIDVAHIHQVQVEVSYILGVFFFVYIGTLFVSPAPEFAYLVPVFAVGIILLIRFAFVPILTPLMDTTPRIRSQQRGLAIMNVPRGLSAAVVATLVISIISLNGFLDTIFVTILVTNVVVTVGIFLFYRPSSPAAEPTAPLPAPPMTPAAANEGGRPAGTMVGTAHVAIDTPCRDAS